MKSLQRALIALSLTLLVGGGAFAKPTASATPAAPAAANATGDFVSSKNSKVFHKVACKSAGKIKPANATYYATKDAAEKAGKQPCKICKP